MSNGAHVSHMNLYSEVMLLREKLDKLALELVVRGWTHIPLDTWLPPGYDASTPPKTLIQAIIAEMGQQKEKP